MKIALMIIIGLLAIALAIQDSKYRECKRNLSEVSMKYMEKEYGLQVIKHQYDSVLADLGGCSETNSLLIELCDKKHLIIGNSKPGSPISELKQSLKDYQYIQRQLIKNGAVIMDDSLFFTKDHSPCGSLGYGELSKPIPIPKDQIINIKEDSDYYRGDKVFTH
jgi:hypothetical protein